MSKTIKIKSCIDCPQAASNGIEPICKLKFINNVLQKDLSIPSWCPLPDSKEQGWEDIATELSSLVDKWKAEVKRLEDTCQFGRYGDDDGRYDHGKRDTLDDCIEAVEGVLEPDPSPPTEDKQ